MGRGAALQATQRIPGIAKEAGDWLIQVWICRQEKPGTPYGFSLVRPPQQLKKKYGFGIFQVKDRFDEPARLELIEFSVKVLRKFATSFPGITIRMNYPGIGFGRLDRSEVQPLLQDLPDNVHIFHR